MSSVVRTAGYTLVELLLYVAIVTALLTTVTMFLSSSVESRVKNQSISEVEQQGALAIDTITQAIRNADSITVPGTGGSSFTVSNSNSGEEIANGSPLTFSATATAGTNRVMVVGINILGSGRAVTGVTFNGTTNLTFLSTVSWPGSAGVTELWYAKSAVLPAGTTTANIVVSYSGAAAEISAGSTVITGADQTGTFGTPATGSGSSTSASVTVLSTNANQFIVNVLGQNGNTPTVSGGETQRWNLHTCCASGSAGATKTAAAGSTPTSWSFGGVSTSWSLIGVALNPATGSVGGTLTLAMPTAGVNPTTFSVSGGALQVTEGASAAVPLTNSKVEVTGLTFRNLSRTGTPGLIQISLTVARVNNANRNEYDYEKTFTSSAALRWP